MSKIRVGVIGLGHGRRHIEGYREHPTAEVVAIADLDDERLDSVGREFGIAHRYDAADALLASDDLDAVSICVPNKFHHDMTLTALGRGLHVLCEKPLAMDAAEATEMAETAAACDRRLTVNFAFRFTAEAQALKAQVAAGRLGGVYFARSVWHRRRFVPGFGGWFTRKQSSGGGAMIDIGVHRLDLALWLMDFPEPDWVLANHWDGLTAPLAEEAGADFDVEDFAAATIRFKNGMMLAVEAS
ncbi:MAG: Gfo/Idh/MocA family oxidoreductase, partial [Planctomycetota bacterium]